MAQYETIAPAFKQYVKQQMPRWGDEAAERIRDMFWNREQFTQSKQTVNIGVRTVAPLSKETIKRKSNPRSLKYYSAWPDLPRVSQADLVDSIQSRYVSDYSYRVSPSPAQMQKAVTLHYGDKNGFGKGIPIPQRPFMGVENEFVQRLSRQWQIEGREVATTEDLGDMIGFTQKKPITIRLGRLIRR
jgi:phage gpG-like protein